MQQIVRSDPRKKNSESHCLQDISFTSKRFALCNSKHINQQCTTLQHLQMSIQSMYQWRKRYINNKLKYMKYSVVHLHCCRNWPVTPSTAPLKHFLCGLITVLSSYNHGRGQDRILIARPRLHFMQRGKNYESTLHIALWQDLRICEIAGSGCGKTTGVKGRAAARPVWLLWSVIQKHGPIWPDTGRLPKRTGWMC